MVEEVPPEEVKERIDDGDVQVVDIRTESEYERGHIPGAVNIPMNRLPTEIDRHDWDGEVVVACPIGKSSIQAAKLIGSYEGVEDAEAVASMEGGYDAWEYELEESERNE
jgi:rhodanese-related sulfurtransferase